MICEYIGESDGGHFIKYKMKTLAFYAIVDLDNDKKINETCRPVDETFAFLEKFHFDKVRCELIAEASDTNQLYQRL